MASASSEIYAAAQEQESAAARSSNSVNEMSATVESLAESAERITATANGVLDNAEQTLATADTMTSRIGELTAQANGVGDLLEVIREVANRSDLLALNGSLEATRAGEAGRGFALVAAEMRRLAERVTGTVTDVRGRVADIKASGSSTVMATEQSRKLAHDTARQRGRSSWSRGPRARTPATPRGRCRACRSLSWRRRSRPPRPAPRPRGCVSRSTSWIGWTAAGQPRAGGLARRCSLMFDDVGGRPR